ncbi:MAG: MarR family transcriptional regulator [Acidobacteriia bacterium]|nr:MarR family transcriptional regulator [Terriglobia bacterium]
MASSTLHRQAETLHQTLQELLQRYQFRNRNEICCFDVSVSQCNALEMLADYEPVSVGELARRMFLEISTVSRVLDQLEKKAYVRRTPAPEDNRAWKLRLTARGRKLLEKTRALSIGQEMEVLKQVPAASRQHVVQAIRSLLQAVDNWRASPCCVPRKLRRVKH